MMGMFVEYIICLGSDIIHLVHKDLSDGLSNFMHELVQLPSVWLVWLSQAYPYTYT